MPICIEYELAKRRVSDYQKLDDPVIAEHQKAMDCWECENRLAVGIRAFRWIQRAEEGLAAAVSEGIIDRHPEGLGGVDVDEAIEALYRLWLMPCAHVEEWAASHEQSDFHVKGLEEFRDCCVIARDWIERNEWLKKSAAARSDLLEAEPW